MYIKISTQQYPMNEAQIRAENPNVSFPVPFMPTADYAFVVSTSKPSFNPSTQWVREVAPVESNGVWYKQWEVVNYTQEELDAMNQPEVQPVPQEVTMRQARLALLDANLLNAVDAAIDAMQSPAREQAIIEWEYSSTVKRDSHLISELMPALGLTEQQVDDLFIAATLK